jgi:hypothetical protein
VAKTPLRGKHTRSINGEHDVHVGVSDPRQSAWAADSGFAHVQKREEPTALLGSAPAGVAKPVSFTLVVHRLSEVARFGFLFGLLWSGGSAVATCLLLWAALAQESKLPGP